MRAKKSFGQNFLKSTAALAKIIEAGEIHADDVILEIGPGRGALTEKLLERSNHIIAVEKDRDLLPFLREKFAREIEAQKLVLVEEDILKFNLLSEAENSFTKKNFSQVLGGPLPQPDHSKKSFWLRYKIIANIPYNITGAILKKFLTEEVQPERMVLLLQKEVGERIVARDHKESILSISVKAYGTPKLLMKVPARYFSPQPLVDSVVVSIKDISRKNFRPPLVLPLSKGEVPKAEGVDEQRFWEIVKGCFAEKRKKLGKKLKKLIPSLEKEKNDLMDKRAEDVTLPEWITLAKK